MGLERKNTVIAIVVGFVSWLVLSSALPSLRWIPYAFVAGVLATVAGLLFLLFTLTRPQSHRADRRSYPVPAFARPRAWKDEKDALHARSAYSKQEIFPKSLKVSRSIDGLLDFVLRDFVTTWYKNISSRFLFQNEVDRAVRDAMGNMRDRLSGLDMVEIGVSRVVPILTSHMQEFYTAERLVRGKNLTRDITESDELDLAIAGKFKDGKLHHAASLAFSDTKLMQQTHVRTAAGKILPLVLREDMKSSPAVTTLIREIVSCAVITPVLLSFCDPDLWNQLIENMGRSMLQERKNVRKVRAALDEHAPASPREFRPAAFPRLRPDDSERQFERFIRAVRTTSTLTDARRFRSEIASQMRKGSATPEQDLVYMRRLDAGKRILDQKILSLSATGNSTVGKRPQINPHTSPLGQESEPTLAQAPLKDVLHNPSGLSYFMEFMDRRNKMRLVQFWITIDGFRNPLEGDNDEPGQTLQEQASYNSGDRMDIAQIKDAYLGLPEVQFSDASKRAVHTYLSAGRSAPIEAYVSARRAILRAQTTVYEEMRKEHFEAFKRSDLFYKWLSTEEASAPRRSLDTIPASPLRSSSDGNRSPGIKTQYARQVAPPVPRMKSPDLRRAAMSSSDLHSYSAQPTASQAARRSIDDSASRPLFDDDIDDDRMTRSVPSLFGAESDGESVNRTDDPAQVVEAMHSALTEILDEPEKDRESLFSEASGRNGFAGGSPVVGSEESMQIAANQGERPSIASLGLVGRTRSTGVFTEDLFQDEERFLEDEKDDSDGPENPVEDDIHEAAPGDLGLTEAIATLDADIERLSAQEAIVDSLTKKAELTNNAAELRILGKSKQSLQREVRRKEMQKQQYVIQESDNSLFGRAAVCIKSIMVGKENDGHEYAIYVIEILRHAGDQMPAATWTVARRYSEFHQLNKRLRARFSAVRNLEFPRRQTIFTLQKDFLQKRRVVLEKYLRALLLMPSVCRSRDLRSFLSQSTIVAKGINGNKIDQGDFVTRIYNSVSDGMEELLGNLPALDQLTTAGQNLITAASQQMNETSTSSVEARLNQDPSSAAEAEAEMNAFEDKESEPFVKPICDLFLETFELQKGNSWLRGRAVVVVVHQLLGGTIERKVRDMVKGYTTDDSLLRYIDMVKDIMWPGGQLRKASVPRTDAEKAKSRKEAGLVLATLVPDMAGGVVGRANAHAASRKMFALLNNQRLTTHLVFTLFDELLQIVFPEITGRG